MLEYLIAIGSLYMYMICPKLRHRNKMEAFKSSPLAHRGIHDNKTVPENSLPSFRAAVDAGVGIELDVQFTRDRQLVVFHDDNLLRMCGVDRKVIELTYEEISALRLLDTDEKIPLLTEVLEAVDGKVPLIVEMKNELHVVWEMPRALYGVMKDYKGEYAIESFNPMFVRKYKKFDKNVARGILAQSFWNVDQIKRRQRICALTLENLMWNFIAKPDFVAYRMQDYRKISFRLNRILGATTVAWGVPKSREELGDKVSKYFDAYICDIESKGGVTHAGVPAPLQPKP